MTQFHAPQPMTGRHGAGPNPRQRLCRVDGRRLTPGTFRSEKRCR